ncbi:MAG: glycoside hydrolase family 2 protein [Abditibacteriota bacterium]|nr:glycoside hydrolase family 2 protein [Abditibacteriota bacterium]
MKQLSLCGAWRLRNLTPVPPGDIDVEARVPGCVHTDLEAAGLTKGAFYRDNEFAEKWICDADYSFSRSFVLPREFTGAKALLLECDGLDTLAKIYLNGVLIAETKNMFRRYSFDISGAAREGENKIEITFASSSEYCRRHAGENRGANLGFSLPGSEQLRKAVYQSGWDWGPQIPTMGIWQDIRICAYEALKLEDVFAESVFPEGISRCRLDVTARVREFVPGCSLTAALYDPEGTLLETKACPGGKASFDIPEPRLWYPAGEGEQPLYRVKVWAGEEAAPLDEKEINAGLRRIEIVREKDEWGRTFFLRVNGRPVFAKGADYVPADQFPSRLREEDYEKLLRSAVCCHMNMIRAWGGAYYEKDCFYDVCDRLGILVWQDFMYACCHYPMTEELMGEYEAEAEDNIRRLQHHACIALWCGNNELEMFLYGGNWPSRETNAACRKDYRRLFYGLIKDVCEREDPGRTYLPASPFDEEGGDPNSETSGDTHYWDVWHGKKPYTEYRKLFPRIMTEFGLQSWPSWEQVKSFSLPEDRQIFSRVMHAHQKDPTGDEDLMYYVGRYFRMPKDIKSYIYVTQLVHACAMRCGAEHWRRNLNGFRCMGVLVWQLNDCWPTVSGAAMEYGGRWKALMYFAREFFAPVLLSLEESGTSVKAHLTNGSRQRAEKNVVVALRDTEGNTLAETAVRGTAEPMSSACILEKDFSEYLKGEGRYSRFVTASFEGEQEDKTAFFVPEKYFEPRKPKISVKARGKALAVTTDVPAFYAYIYVPDKYVRLGRNFITLLPGKEYLLDIEEDGGLSPEEAAERAEVLTLADTYESSY